MKRARAEMEEVKEGGSAESKEQDKVDLPTKKQCRVGRRADAEEEDEGSNFLTRLPYLALRRVLDYLTPSTSSSSGTSSSPAPAWAVMMG